MKRLNRITICLSIIVVLIIPGLIKAQSKAYKIGPSDILVLTIHAGGEEQYKGELTVSSQGKINAPFIGAVAAKGLTPSQLEQAIEEPLAQDYFVNPKVDIGVKEYHSLHYYISGAVKKPGLYKSHSETSLLELIAKAEGVLSDRGNVAYIMRRTIDNATQENGSAEDSDAKKPITVDLKQLLDKGDLSANPTLEPGDVVYIPLKESLDLAESKIYIEGEVKNPGVFDFQPGITAMSACIIAGGFSRFAAPNRTRIIRKTDDKSEIIKINLNRVKEGKIPDIKLQPGDRVHVPETWL